MRPDAVPHDHLVVRMPRPPVLKCYDPHQLIYSVGIEQECFLGHASPSGLNPLRNTWHPIPGDLFPMDKRVSRASLSVIVAVLVVWPLWVRAEGHDSTRSSPEGEYSHSETAAVVVRMVQPTYPAFAREAQISGRVILHALVGPDGRVKRLKIVRAVTGLDSAAVQSVRQWVFRPVLSNHKPVSVWIEVPVSFPIDACPPEVVEGGRASLVSRVGERFFADCLTLDSAGCRLVPNWIGRSRVYQWALAYSLKVPKKPWVKGTIRVVVDTTGVLASGQGIEGIGNCAHHPEECDFSVDEETARAIAKRGGLEPGLTPWRTEFRWGKWPRPCYAWLVANTLRTDGSGGTTQ